MKAATKAHRVAEANKVILAISNHGRRFFYYGPGGESSRDVNLPDFPEGRVARFEVGAGGRIWLRDDYTWRPVYVAYAYEWRHFSHGGTMESIIRALHQYIRTGEPMRGHLGPWPAWLGGDPWGYGDEAMAAVRAEARLSDAMWKPEAVAA